MGRSYRVFPAHAGMSPTLVYLQLADEGFPRTRGDEPANPKRSAPVPPFSPHTRG